MKSLLIEDLPFSETLDHAAASRIRGGMTVAPGGCMPSWPWPMPEMPAWPELPDMGSFPFPSPPPGPASDPMPVDARSGVSAPSNPMVLH